MSVWILFSAAVLVLVRLELHSDDAGVIAFLILLSTFLLAYLEPRRVRLWVFTGWSVPAAALVAGKSVPDLHRIPGILILLAFTTILGGIGTYSARFVRRSITG